MLERVCGSEQDAPGAHLQRVIRFVALRERGTEEMMREGVGDNDERETKIMMREGSRESDESEDFVSTAEGVSCVR